MSTTVGAATTKPTNPIELPTGTRVTDKFDKLFRRLFGDGELISIEAEETFPGVNNGGYDGVWYTEAAPFLIRVCIDKDDDGNPGIEVSLSKKKTGQIGSGHANFTKRELELLRNYKIGVYDHRNQKASHLVPVHADEACPRFEIPLSFCDQELDPSVTLPIHRETDAQFPYSFSIFVVKNTEKK